MNKLVMNHFTKMEYRLLGTPSKNGHHFWEEVGTGRLVISDQSADDSYTRGPPWKTDDGTLYVRVDELCFIPRGFFDGEWAKYLPGSGYSIPVCNAAGEKSVTPSNAVEFAWVIAYATSKVEKVKETKRVYYAHCLSLFDTKQEERDVCTLESMGVLRSESKPAAI